IVRGILQPGGMPGQLPMLVDVVVLVGVVVLLEVVVVLEVVDVVDVVVLVVVLVVVVDVVVVVVAHLTFTFLPATNSRTQAAPVKVVPSPRSSRALGAVMKAWTVACLPMWTVSPATFSNGGGVVPTGPKVE